MKMIHETHEKHERKIKIIRVNSCNSWAREMKRFQAIIELKPYHGYFFVTQGDFLKIEFFFPIRGTGIENHQETFV
jgi:hypothetical protein